jgi:hypothetical protein
VVILANSRIALRLPASQSAPARGPIPGPVLAIRRGDSPWFGRGRLATPVPLRCIDTAVTAAGPLFTQIAVTYSFATGRAYVCTLTLRPEDDVCEIAETSTLPVRLWPAPAPYREFGTLGASHWDRDTSSIGAPCIRPCPRSNVIFDLRHGFTPDRLQTHSTAAWEIMDLPLQSPVPKVHTAMRASYVAVDGGWLGVYDSAGDTMVGVASIDLAHWRAPDGAVHPVHRTPGVHADVALVDDEASTHFRLPIENIGRRWLLAAVPLARWQAAAGRQAPMRLESDPQHPLWAARSGRGDLPLQKVKDWVLAWRDRGHAHPRIFCGTRDFPAIRERVHGVPELRALYDQTRDIRPADRFVVDGEPSGLDAIEAVTGLQQILADILAKGYIGPNYCIALARPARRYAVAADMLWPVLSADERRTVRRTCALAAYILTDGDWWQYAWRAGETTYLPNFNTDVFCCAGIIGILLSDHPCAELWQAHAATRMHRELKHHLRRDGGGEENVGSYLMSTWNQLYMPLLWALRHAGVHDFSGDPNVLAGARFLTRVIGPADPRDGGIRMIPPIGHHPYARKCFPFVPQLASFISKSAPALAAELMWIWHQSGSPVGNSFDHSGPMANPLTRHYIFHDATIQPVPPRLRSAALPHVGAVLRSDTAERPGSFLFLKAGRVHSHHDEDEGSFHYFGRGVPLVLDGLRLDNGAGVDEHNAVSFDRDGQPSAVVEHLHSTRTVDYLRAVVAPRAFACDAMYLEDTHRSGWTRELVLVKSTRPGGVEYLVVKDTVTGPDACQWNLDVLSAKPRRTGAGRLWFPGQPDLNMGMDLVICEPADASALRLRSGPVRGEAAREKHRTQLNAGMIDWDFTEHWLVHLPAAAGATFFAVLFPRPPMEAPPAVTYLMREECLAVAHADGRDLIFLRPNPRVGVSLDGVRFQGRAGVCSDRGNRRRCAACDADVITLT